MADTTASSSLADTAIRFTDIVGKVANVALKIDRGIEAVDAVLGNFAAFIPYYSQAIAVAKIADPILAKVAQYAPAVEGGIELARPVIEAAQDRAPELIGYVKQVMAHAHSNDPGAVAKVAASDISDEAARAFGTLMFTGTKLESVWEASWFTPQDPRFERASGIPG